MLVLTRAPGLTPEEVERLVTRPIELGLGGIPGMVKQRSISRYGIASISAVFTDAVDPWLARQMVQERLALVSNRLPEGVEAPELGPLTGGLGEIFHFTVGSPVRTPAELLELVELRVVPLLRSVPGVVEVNTWGGERRTLDVVGQPDAMARWGVDLGELEAAVVAATGTAAGSSLTDGPDQMLLRGVARPTTPWALGGAMVRPARSGASALLADAYTNIVGVKSSQATTTDLIAPGDPTTSYLYLKLTGAQATVPGGGDGDMPDELPPLPADKLTLVEDWILAGALDD